MYYLFRFSVSFSDMFHIFAAIIYKPMDNIVSVIVNHARNDLRNHLHESVYATAKRAGMRAETVQRIEAGQGSARELCKYVDAWCRHRPDVAYRLFYSLSSVIAQFKD